MLFSCCRVDDWEHRRLLRARANQAKLQLKQWGAVLILSGLCPPPRARDATFNMPHVYHQENIATKSSGSPQSQQNHRKICSFIGLINFSKTLCTSFKVSLEVQLGSAERSQESMLRKERFMVAILRCIRRFRMPSLCQVDSGWLAASGGKVCKLGTRQTAGGPSARATGLLSNEGNSPPLHLLLFFSFRTTLEFGHSLVNIQYHDTVNLRNTFWKEFATNVRYLSAS